MHDGIPPDYALRATLTEHDIVIVGAGLSGICAAWHLTRARPADDIAILEARDAMGGTWDLFRYPGIRSDSDMPTLGFQFRPWLGEKSIADGPSIREYIHETADESGLTERIRFGHRLKSANWDSALRRWRLTVEVAGETAPREFRCRFLMMCTGYYRYSAGHTPEFEGIDDYEGRHVHPQQWPEDLELEGKRVAVIGSGATAVTLVPELAKLGAHVTMVQRTPT
ncbi:MAG: NAD(P)/FAD-dependent oxidoreductase [Pseudomonadota bacterium]